MPTGGKLKRVLLFPLKFLGYMLLAVLLAVLVLGIVAWANSPGETPPVAGAGGKGIARWQELDINQSKLWVLLRGADSTQPVLLFVHGGPGAPEEMVFRTYNPGLERQFTVAYLHQRGSGRSYEAGKADTARMNLQTLADDLNQVAAWLSSHFGQPKILLMGHSFGSLVSVLALHGRPELYRAYFGIGQIARQGESEHIMYASLLAEARRRNSTKAVEALGNLPPPPGNNYSKKDVDKAIALHRYAVEYNGMWVGKENLWPYIRAFLAFPDYTLWQKVTYPRANWFSLHQLVPKMMAADLFAEAPALKVPVFLFHGTQDLQVMPEVTFRYFQALKAPVKHFYWFRNTAHMVQFEQPVLFNQLVASLAADPNAQPAELTQEVPPR